MISRSILFEYTRLGSAGCVEDSVVFGRYCVDKEGNAAHEADAELDWVGDARAREEGGSDQNVFTLSRES